MGLLQKSSIITAQPGRGGLLKMVVDSRETFHETQAAAVPSFNMDTKVKKKQPSFRSLLSLCENLLLSFEGEKVGLLCPFGDFYIPFFLKGYDKTTLNKYRICKNLISSHTTTIAKETLKNVISVREYLNDDDRDFYFHLLSSSQSELLLMLRYKCNTSHLHEQFKEILNIAENLNVLNLPAESQTVYTSENDIKPQIITAQLENLNRYIFSLSYDDFINHLNLCSDCLQELFIIQVIHRLIHSTFQNSAYIVKSTDNLFIYFFSISRQNPILLQHHINRILSEYFFGDTESSSIIVTHVSEN